MTATATPDRQFRQKRCFSALHNLILISQIPNVQKEMKNSDTIS